MVTFRGNTLINDPTANMLLVNRSILSSLVLSMYPLELILSVLLLIRAAPVKNHFALMIA
jgi:hypothetical protein